MLQLQVEDAWLRVVSELRAQLFTLNDAKADRQAAVLNHASWSVKSAIAGKVSGPVEVAVGYSRTESQDTLSSGLSGDPWKRTLRTQDVDSAFVRSFATLLSSIQSSCESDIDSAIKSASVALGCDASTPALAVLRDDLMSFLGGRVESVQSLIKYEALTWSYQAAEAICRVSFVDAA